MVCLRDFNPRSPHGERLDAEGAAAPPVDFNPRSPHGERLRRRRHASLRRSISIHAPRTGSDAVQASLRGKRLISIHAPRTGSDCPQRRFPRSLPISIHAPRTGSDPNPRICQKLREDFNPRSPHGERRLWRMTTIFLLQISIHAPRTGSDRGSALRRRTLRVFQSTLPARGATRARTLTQITDLFQSTLPARGATRAPCESSADRSDFNPRSPHGERPPLLPAAMRCQIHFNPRSPHGERPAFCPIHHDASRFQSTLPARGATAMQT